MKKELEAIKELSKTVEKLHELVTSQGELITLMQERMDCAEDSKHYPSKSVAYLLRNS